MEGMHEDDAAINNQEEEEEQQQQQDDDNNDDDDDGDEEDNDNEEEEEEDEEEEEEEAEPAHPELPALILAASQGHWDVVRQLIEAHPELINLELGEDCLTVFLLAVADQNLEMMDWLLGHGANVNHQDPEGYTPLMRTCITAEHPQMIAALLARGADPSMFAMNGSNPLMMSALRGFVIGIKVLVKDEKVDVNAQSPITGMTALHWVIGRTEAEATSVAVIKLLLNVGADPMVPSSMNNMLPIQYASIKGRSACVAVLKEAMENLFVTFLMHKARCFNDASYALTKVAAEGGRTREEKRRKLIAAAPAYLKDRVERDGIESLPVIAMAQESSRKRKEEEEGKEEEKVKAVFDYVVKEGRLASELYIELLDWMAEPYDGLRKKRNQG